MENEQKLIKAFVETLGLNHADVNDGLEYGAKSWDSIGHMALITAIETEFDIMIETDDVIDMSSYLKAKEILQKYEIQI